MCHESSRVRRIVRHQDSPAPEGMQHWSLSSMHHVILSQLGGSVNIKQTNKQTSRILLGHCRAVRCIAFMSGHSSSDRCTGEPQPCSLSGPLHCLCAKIGPCGHSYGQRQEGRAVRPRAWPCACQCLTTAVSAARAVCPILIRIYLPAPERPRM